MTRFNREEEIRAFFFEYLKGTVLDLPQDKQAEALAWRESCFDSGLKLIRYLESEIGSLENKRILDCASGWGGHAVAFATRNTFVQLSDLNDHKYDALGCFCKSKGLNTEISLASCELLPFEDSSFDIIIALELIEHISDLDAFAREVARLLRPGGIAVMSTPPRLRSIFEGEPHWGLKGLACVPFYFQRRVAEKFFHKSYPFPITNQFGFAATALSPFCKRGLLGRPVVIGRLNRVFSKVPLIYSLIKELLWSFLIVSKSASK